VLRGDSSQADADTAAPHQEEYRMTMLAALVDGVIGVDPHRDTLTAAAVTNLGGVLAQTTTSADAAGYQQLIGFADRRVPYEVGLFPGGGVLPYMWSHVAGTLPPGLSVQASPGRIKGTMTVPVRAVVGTSSSSSATSTAARTPE
jgi:hypothetical protein